MSQSSGVIEGIVLESELASNDQYRVFVGRRGDEDGERVIVKVAREVAQLDPLTVGRLRREACTLFRFSCPALPRMFSFGLTLDGRAFSAFELFTEPRLSERLQEATLTLAQGWQLATEIAAALRVLHAARVAHGSVDAEHIHVRQDPEHPFCLSLRTATHREVSNSAQAAQGQHWRNRVRQDLGALGDVLHVAMGWKRSERTVAAGAKPTIGSEAALRYLAARLCADGDEGYPSAEACWEQLWKLVPAKPQQHREMFEPPMVGRYVELIDIEAAADEAVGVEIAVLYGQPGMGKTRLLKELSARAPERGSSLLTTSGKHEEIRSFGAIARLFERYLDATEVGASERSELLLRLAGKHSALLQLLHLSPIVRPRGSLPNSDELIAEGLAEVVVKLLTELGTKLILAVDDFQWVDEASRRVLRRVVEQLSPRRDAGFLLVLAAREQAEYRLVVRRFLEALSRSPVLEMALEPLTALQTMNLLRQCFGRAALDGEGEQALAFISDGSPLSVNQVIESVFDRGYLVPSWGSWRLDVLGVAGMQLPSLTSDLLIQRMQRLELHTREVLEVAAILGMEFPYSWLVSSCGDTSDAAHGIEEALTARVLAEGRDGRLHFAHQALRDALLAQLPPGRAQQLHARVFLALRPKHPVDSAEDEAIYKLAEHALASNFRDQELGQRLALEAGRRSHRAFDSARGRFFLSALDRKVVDVESYWEAKYLLGEAWLRAGRFDDGLACFSELAEEIERGPLRARALARRAWVYESRFDSVAAWRNLELAFEAVGERIPELGPRHFLSALTPVGARAINAEKYSPEGIEILSSMYLQTARLASITGRGKRFLAATALGAQLARRAGDQHKLSRAHAALAVVFAILGWHSRATRQLEVARRIAEETGEPQAVAHLMQMTTICACWRGDVEEAIRVGAECLNTYDSAFESWEYYLLIYNQQLLESLLGRGREAWRWMHRVGQRLLQSEKQVAFPKLLYYAARAAALNQGNERQFERMLVGVRECCAGIPRGSAFEVLAYGVRLRRYTEVYQFDGAFEALVSEFEQQAYDPRHVHLVVVEYYVHLAHARLEQAFRLPAAQLGAFLPRVVRAVDELQRASRVPLVEGHTRVCRATLRVLQQRYREAEREFDAAQAMAAAQGAPWVLWAVFKGRAHLAQRRAQYSAMRDFAQLAVNIALEHGAVHRAAAVQRHFFRSATPAQPWQNRGAFETARRESERTERQLAALLRAGQVAARQSHHEHQVREVLDETIAALNARRGFLWVRQSDALSGFVRLLGKRFVLMVARGADHDDLPPTAAPEVERVLVKLGDATVRLWEQPVNLDGGPPRAVMAARLVVNDQLVGVISVEGPMENCPFSARDADLLLALAGQATLVLELARALRDRDRLTDDLRHAQKMEAVGRLAGGMAHDFNNMIAAIRVAVDAAMQLSGPYSDAIEELETVRDAALRSADVTRKLLAFSRRQVLKCRPLNLSEVIETLIPTMRRLLGRHLEIETQLSQELVQVYADPSQLEHVLINLAVNARDAMPAGGVFSIATRNRRIEAEAARDLRAGNYVEIEVSDTGVGMEDRVRQRIFEPYFTTKLEDQGTGLGLSMAYGIVRQSGGDIAVESRVGEGTRFVILLPEGNKKLMRAYEEPVAARVEPVSLVFNGEPTVLLVEDDALLRGALERTLTRSGFRVLAVADGPAAMTAARGAERIDVAVIDLILPEMNGLQLARNLLRMGIYGPFLYMSGHADQLLTDAQIARADLLQKPMSSREFVARVQAALARSKTAPKPRPRLRLVSGPQR